MQSKVLIWCTQITIGYLILQFNEETSNQLQLEEIHRHRATLQLVSRISKQTFKTLRCVMEGPSRSILTVQAFIIFIGYYYLFRTFILSYYYYKLYFKLYCKYTIQLSGCKLFTNKLSVYLSISQPVPCSAIKRDNRIIRRAEMVVMWSMVSAGFRSPPFFSPLSPFLGRELGKGFEGHYPFVTF